MLFTVNDQNYRISFAHIVYPKPVAVKLAGGEKSIRGETHCFLALLPASDPAKKEKPEAIKQAEGVARCSVADSYNKEKGRQLALRRALETLWPEQHEIWGVAFRAYTTRKAIAWSGR